MKKLLLASSALVSLAATSAMAGGNHAPSSYSSAQAGGLSVMVGGYVTAEHAVVDQANQASGGTANDKSFTQDAEVHVTVAGSAEDFDYGAVIELNATVDNDADSDGQNADKTYIFVEGDDFGRVEFGSNEGASSTLEIDASNIARATGGVDGNWYYYVDTDGVNTASTFYIAPNLTVADDDATQADASKITYYTPRMSGFQFGVSYTPDGGDLGSAGALSTSSNTGNQYENIFALGLSYDTNVEGVGVALSAVTEMGDNQNTTNSEDLEGYSVGAQLDFDAFSIAGNYADLGETGQVANSGYETSYWTLGAAYENGPYGVSVTYLNSIAENANGDNELTNIVVGADYNLAPGFTPYIEAAFFDLEDANTSNADNAGSVVLFGAELAF